MRFKNTATKKSCISQGNTIIKAKFFHELGKAAYHHALCHPSETNQPQVYAPNTSGYYNRKWTHI